MREINTSALFNSCKLLASRCSDIPCGEFSSSAEWLFDNSMKAFSCHPACVSYTLCVNINHVGIGYATLSFDGSLVMRRTNDEC